MNEVDPFIFRCMFLYEIQNCIFHVFSQHPSHLPWTVYAYGRDGFARECIVPCNLNVMGYSFPPNTRVVSSSFIFFPLSLSLSFGVTNPYFFQLQPAIQEHEELVGLAGNFKLGVTNYSRSLYGPRRVAYPGSGDDEDDDDGGGEEDSEATPSYQPRKRQQH